MTTEAEAQAPTIEVLSTGPEPLRVVRPTEADNVSCKKHAMLAFQLAAQLVTFSPEGSFVPNIPEADQTTNHPYLAFMSNLTHYAQVVCRNNLGLASFGAHGMIRVEHKDPEIAAQSQPTLLIPLFVSKQAVHGICIDLTNPESPQLDYASVYVTEGNYQVTGIY